MGIAVDYSFDKPTISTLQLHDVVAVGRYDGPPSWGKTITSTEAQSLRSVGIVFWLVFEDGHTGRRSQCSVGHLEYPEYV
jgi:hypothetical protein